MSHKVFQGILWLGIVIIFLTIVLLKVQTPQVERVNWFYIQTPQTVCAVRG